MFLRDATERHAILSRLFILDEIQVLYDCLSRAFEPNAYYRYGEHAWRKFQSWLEKDGGEFLPYCQQWIHIVNSCHQSCLSYQVLSDHQMMRPILEQHLCNPSGSLYSRHFNSHFPVKHASFSSFEADIY